MMAVGTNAGGTGVVPKLHIAHAAVEMAPIAKVGGMGDVVTALSRAVQEDGHRVDVFLPKYDILKYGEIDNLRLVETFQHNNTNVQLWKGTVEGLTVRAHGFVGADRPNSSEISSHGRLPNSYCSVHSLSLSPSLMGRATCAQVSFVDPQNGMFQHGCIYGRNDDHIRFRFFAEAVGTYIRQMANRGERPDVVHAHDWQTAPLTWENLAVRFHTGPM